jgi:hypothetical protein
MALWEHYPSGLRAALGLLVFALGAWAQSGDATSAQNESIDPELLAKAEAGKSLNFVPMEYRTAPNSSSVSPLASALPTASHRHRLSAVTPP